MSFVVLRLLLLGEFLLLLLPCPLCVVHRLLLDYTVTFYGLSSKFVEEHGESIGKQRCLGNVHVDLSACCPVLALH